MTLSAMNGPCPYCMRDEIPLPVFYESQAEQQYDDHTRKLFAALLRDVSTTFHCRALAGTKNGKAITQQEVAWCMFADVNLKELANQIESGEWVPQLKV